MNIGKKNALNLIQILRKKYHKFSLNFEMNIGYIEQATRNGFFAEFLDDTLVVYTKKELNIDSNFVVVLAVGKNPLDIIVSIVKKLKGISIISAPTNKRLFKSTLIKLLGYMDRRKMYKN